MRRSSPARIREPTSDVEFIAAAVVENLHRVDHVIDSAAECTPGRAVPRRDVTRRRAARAGELPTDDEPSSVAIIEDGETRRFVVQAAAERLPIGSIPLHDPWGRHADHAREVASDKKCIATSVVEDEHVEDVSVSAGLSTERRQPSRIAGIRLSELQRRNGDRLIRSADRDPLARDEFPAETADRCDLDFPRFHRHLRRQAKRSLFIGDCFATRAADDDCSAEENSGVGSDDSREGESSLAEFSSTRVTGFDAGESRADQQEDPKE